MEFTCIKCEFKFHESRMDTDERMCYDCLEEDENTEDQRDPNIRRSVTMHYPDWDIRNKEYIVPPRQRRTINV